MCFNFTFRLLVFIICNLDVQIFINLNQEIMAVLKVIEVLSSSSESWEEATKNAVKEASKSVQNIRSVYVNEQSCVVDGNNISQFRVNVKITFEVK